MGDNTHNQDTEKDKEPLKEDNQESYLIEGMWLGLSLGAIVGLLLFQYIGVTMGLGMLWGTVIGSNFKKK